MTPDWRHVVCDEQFLTSPFLLAFTSFHTSLNFFGRGPPGPLKTLGPRGTCPGYPPPSVGLNVSSQTEQEAPTVARCRCSVHGVKNVKYDTTLCI